MTEELDLFGEPISKWPFRAHPGMTETEIARRRKYETPRGYAATPGTGPKGHFCRDCRFAKRSPFQSGSKKHFWKCKLRWTEWAKSARTDIRLKSPACAKWIPRLEKDSPKLIEGKLKPQKFVNLLHPSANIQAND